MSSSGRCELTPDVFYTNSRYAKVGGLPSHELNQLELQFLLLNDFRLVILPDEMQRYGDRLLSYWEAREEVTEAEVQAATVQPSHPSQSEATQSAQPSQPSQAAGPAPTPPQANPTPPRGREATARSAVSFVEPSRTGSGLRGWGSGEVMTGRMASPMRD